MANEDDLVISAGFSDAQLVKEANRVVELYRKKGEEAQKAFVDAQGKVTNTQATRAHARELDKLSRNYDPVYRAAKKYEEELKRLDRALDVGAVSQQRYTELVGQAAKQFNQATGTVQDTSRGMGGSLQQVGFQVGDFATQVGAGTSAVQALGQQLPQLLGAFGTWGAIAGAGAAITIPLGAALVSLALDTETLDEKLEKLSDTTDDYSKAAEAAAQPISLLRQQYGDLADEVQRANSVMAYLKSIQAQTDLFSAARSISREAGFNLATPSLPVQADGTVNINQQYKAARQLENEMAKLNDKTKATADQTDRLRMALNRTDSSNSLGAVVKDAENLLAVIAELSLNEGADKGFLAGWAQQVEAVMRAAQDQIAATKSEFERVSKQYETDTEKLKSLSNDRKVAQEALDKAIKEGGDEAILIGRERIKLIDAEIDKTRDLIRANDDAYVAMQKRIKAGAGAWLDGIIQSATGSSLTQWGKDITASQKGILDLIASRESGGDYNATLDNGRWTDGARDLVNMTIKEILALQSTMRTPENRALYGNGAGSSALGRYQIVGSTLDGLVKELNLTGDELFSKEMQDRLALQLVRRRLPQGVEGLRQEWAGLQNVSPAVIQSALGQQSIERVDPENAKDRQEALDKEVKERERIAKQVKAYGEDLAKNLLTEQQQAALAKQQAEQIAAIKASGMSDQQQASAIAAVNGEIEKQKTVFALLEEAKRRQVDLDAKLVNGTMTYRQAIEALGEQKKQQIVTTEELAQAEERAGQKIDFAAQMQKSFEEGLIDSIVAGESFSDVLGNIAQMIAKAMLQAALFNQGPWATGSGSGLLGGLTDVIFGGFRAAGGDVAAGRAYVVGEKGPEVIVPKSPGTVIPNHELGGGGLTASFAPNINLNHGVTQSDLAMAMTAARVEYERRFLPMLRKNMPRYNERFA